MLRKICIVTDQHISSNPRVWKEATTLSEKGYEVVIVTIQNSEVHKQRDEFFLNKLGKSVRYLIADNQISSEIGIAKRILYKLRTLFAFALKKLNIESKYLLSKNPDAIFKMALKQNADLYIGHVDCSLYVGKKLIKAGKKVAFDFEDWYSEDYIHQYRAFKLLRKLEAFALKNGAYVTCPSLSMADALQNRYSPCKTVDVIYNGFPDEVEVRDNDSGTGLLRLVWFSQTVGEGRGLEKIISAIRHVNIPLKLTLIGDCSNDYKSKLISVFPTDNGHLLEFMGAVPHQDLHNTLAGFDIGLALENNTPQSRNKTITNKILQYLQAGIKVLATNTDGQIEVNKYFPEVVKLVDVNNETEWGIKLQELVMTSVRRSDVIEKYNNVFAWKTQEKKLLELVSGAVNE